MTNQPNVCDSYRSMMRGGKCTNCGWSEAAHRADVILESATPKACKNYTRPHGVLGGPCLNCGRSQPEHAKRHIHETELSPRDPHPDTKPKEYMYSGINDMFDRVTWKLVQALLKGDLQGEVRQQLMLVVRHTKEGTLYPDE